MALTKASSGVINQSLSVATLQATTVKATNMQDANSTAAMNVPKLAATGSRYVRNSYTQIHTPSVSATTAWTLGFTFADISMKAGSLVKMHYMIPSRNDSTSWGGTYIEPQVRFNSGAWQSLGSCGYDGGTMHNGSADIASYHNSILINPGIGTDFTVAFRFYFASYDGTTTINGSNNINATSGTATIMPGDNGIQHYAHIIVDELALFRGDA